METAEFSVEVRNTYIIFSVRSNYLKFNVLNAAKTRILVLQHIRVRSLVGGNKSLKIYFVDLSSTRQRQNVLPKR